MQDVNRETLPLVLIPASAWGSGYGQWLPHLFEVRNMAPSALDVQAVRVGEGLAAVHALAVGTITALALDNAAPLLIGLLFTGLLVGAYEWALWQPGEPREEEDETAPMEGAVVSGPAQLAPVVAAQEAQE